MNKSQLRQNYSMMGIAIFLPAFIIPWLLLSHPIQAIQIISLNSIKFKNEYFETKLDNTSALYLPIIFNKYIPPPSLIAPLNGAVLDTLIPMFEWNMGVQPSNTKAKLIYGTELYPGANVIMGFGSSGSYSTLPWDNLQPSTTYYWRVGAVYDYNWDEPNWSEQWSFTTGPSGGVILPPPILISPANGSTITKDQAILTWQALPDAVEYSVMVYSSGGSPLYGFVTPNTQINLKYYSTLTKPGSSYSWSVRTRNDYAWGYFSEEWYYSISQ